MLLMLSINPFIDLIDHAQVLRVQLNLSRFCTVEIRDCKQFRAQLRLLPGWLLDAVYGVW